jgi:hypothetical protein
MSAPKEEMYQTAPSLKPGLEMMLGCVLNVTESIAIRDAYQFCTSRATRLTIVDTLTLFISLEDGSSHLKNEQTVHSKTVCITDHGRTLPWRWRMPLVAR